MVSSACVRGARRRVEATCSVDLRGSAAPVASLTKPDILRPTGAARRQDARYHRPTVRVVVSPSAEERLACARAWLAERGASEELVVVSTTQEASASLARSAPFVATFGWHRVTLSRFSSALATPRLAEQGLTLAPPLALEAVCARVVDRLARAHSLGRFQPVGDRPGLVRAVARTLHELRHAATSEHLDPDLARILGAYAHELSQAHLADRADMLRVAAERARERAPHPLLDRPTLFVDVELSSVRDAELVAVIAARAKNVLATAPVGDSRSIEHWSRALGESPERLQAAPAPPHRSLARVQACLFSEAQAEVGVLGDDVTILSAPGESRECVEIARRIHRFAERGVPFDRMAIALRAPSQYRPHLEEALRRAAIPGYFAHGSVQPDPAGRAFLTLLSCAAEQLSAQRFAEYLSLAQVPDATIEGAPPPPLPSEARFVPADVDIAPQSVARALAEEAEVEAIPDDPRTEDPDATPVVAGSLRAPRRWEHLLVEAAVIGGRERWSKRLDGLKNKLKQDLEHESSLEPDGPYAAQLQRTLDELDSLRRFALPLLDALVALPRSASWGEWLDALSRLATQSIRRPQRVLSVLAELAPMADVGPVALDEVRLVLEPRLRELVVAPSARRAGKVFVAKVDALRGLSFEVVFVPGLAEKLFPQKVVEDPLLPDAARVVVDRTLETNQERVAAERLSLRIAIGAARDAVVLSYPRLDSEQARPRVPSFYGLEVLRAAEGRLAGFDELTRRAEQGGAARIAWPAPRASIDAIDDAEHDLSVIAALMERPLAEARGAARFLLTFDPTDEADARRHLSRALRFRARRWIRKWTSADGLVEPIPEARLALGKHGFSQRSFSPTALQNFALCPYKFLLHTIHRLSPRQTPEAIEEIDPLQRGKLVHEVMFELLSALQREGALPLSPSSFEPLRDRLDALLDWIAERYHDDLSPAIPRVWDDGVASMRADLREWLRRACESQDGWVPHRFELSFGLRDRRAEDSHSQKEAVALDCGVRLRGSIDLVEQNAQGALRATDYKTGKVRAEQQSVVSGGKVLQPLLYALVLERMFPESKIDSGRLYYCTHAGGYEAIEIPLDTFARTTVADVVAVVADAIERGFLPAAPAERECEWCDYQVVCGPHEEQRTKRKAHDALASLRRLRALP